MDGRQKMGRCSLPGNLTPMAAQPPRPTSGTSILLWCGRLWDFVMSLRPVAGPGIAMRQSANGTVISVVPQPRKKAEIPPFTVTLHVIPEPKSYYVTVTEGKVIERWMKAAAADESLFYHPCPSRLDEDGYPTEFPIEVGEAIFVDVTEVAAGGVDGGSVDLAVRAADTKSSARAGVWHYKLAEVELDGDGLARLKPVAAGSHIYHPTGLTADVILEDCSGDQYAVPPVPGNQLMRLSFLSGKLVGLNETPAARPLAATVAREQFTPCSESYPT